MTINRVSVKFIFSFLFISVGFVASSNAQETLNQLDSIGKKHGKWEVYLNKVWKPLKDTVGAKYLRYTYYDHGTNIYPMGPWGGKGLKLERVGSNRPQMAKILILNGEFKWVNEKGVVRSAHVFSNGEYVSMQEFYSSGKLDQIFDYTKKYENQKHGWAYTKFNKKGVQTYDGNFRKGKQGWTIYPNVSGNNK